MNLPVLNTPTYEMEIPSTGEKIKYRPFLVKEQKLLMMAQEAGDEDTQIRTVGDIVKSCTFNKISNLFPTSSILVKILIVLFFICFKLYPKRS